jgi:hypothetical protein
MFNIDFKKEKGMSLLYIVFITTILLAIASGISSILVYQVKIMSGIGHSVVAFYAADSGIERVLMDWNSPPEEEIEETLSNLATYKVSVFISGDGGCEADNYCIRSVGTYKDTKRAIEISY